MAQIIFKGFKTVNSDFTGFENDYIYFVRTNADGTEGYIRFNDKMYGTAYDDSVILSHIGEIEAQEEGWNNKQDALSDNDGSYGQRVKAIEDLLADAINFEVQKY